MLLLALGVGAFILLRATRVVPEPDDAAADAPAVAVMTAEPVEVRRQYVGYGTARAMDSADVPARVAATVTRIPAAVEAGALVTRGDLLVELDDSDFRAQVESATAAIAEIDAQRRRLEVEQKAVERRVGLAREEVELARADYDRVRDASERGAAVERELDVARQALIRALRDEVIASEQLDQLGPRREALDAARAGQRANLRLAEQNLERTRIVSPLDGSVESLDVEVGENVAPGTRVARIVDLSRIEVGLRLPAAARVDVGPGDRVELRSAGAGRQTWSAPVARVAPADDPASRTMTVYVEVDQDGGAAVLAPGLFTAGTVISARPEQRWVVPRRAVQNDRITLVDDGVTVSLPIEVDYRLQGQLPQLGLPDDQWLVLERPLERGALVVLNGSRQLADGTSVRPVTPDGETLASSEPDRAAGGEGRATP